MQNRVRAHVVQREWQCCVTRFGLPNVNADYVLTKLHVCRVEARALHIQNSYMYREHTIVDIIFHGERILP